MSSFGTYLIGFIVLIVGLAVEAFEASLTGASRASPRAASRGCVCGAHSALRVAEVLGRSLADNCGRASPNLHAARASGGGKGRPANLIGGVLVG